MATQSVPAIGSDVILSGGKKTGKVTSLISDGLDDAVSGFVVHYGWRKNKAKFVPLGDVKWVNPNNVIVNLSRRQFSELSNWTAEETSETTATGEVVHSPAHS